MITEKAKVQSAALTSSELEILYRARFREAERARKDAIWRVLCAHFLQRYVRETDTVLDVACGFGEFSRHIRAAKIIAVDLNPDAAKHLQDSGVEFHLAAADRLSFLSDASIDVAFTSNFLEHLPSKGAVNAVLQEVNRVLRPGGSFVALQPNIRYAYREYWDFYDHHVALSHNSYAEALQLSGFKVVEIIDRFLPFSTKGKLPTHPFLVRAYLAFPPAWRLFGKQFLVTAEKNSA